MPLSVVPVATVVVVASGAESAGCWSEDTHAACFRNRRLPSFFADVGPLVLPFQVLGGCE